MTTPEHMARGSDGVRDRFGRVRSSAEAEGPVQANLQEQRANVCLPGVEMRVETMNV